MDANLRRHLEIQQVIWEETNRSASFTRHNGRRMVYRPDPAWHEDEIPYQRGPKRRMSQARWNRKNAARKAQRDR